MRRRKIGRPIKIEIDRSAVFAGVLVLILFMHVIIGMRFASWEQRLGVYNEHIATQTRVNSQHLIMIAGNQEVNWRQSMYMLPQLNCTDCHR